MLAREWVELAFSVLLAWVLFVLIIERRVVHVTFADAIFVAF